MRTVTQLIAAHDMIPELNSNVSVPELASRRDVIQTEGTPSESAMIAKVISAFTAASMLDKFR